MTTCPDLSAAEIAYLIVPASPAVAAPLMLLDSLVQRERTRVRAALTLAARTGRRPGGQLRPPGPVVTTPIRPPPAAHSAPATALAAAAIGWPYLRDKPSRYRHGTTEKP